MAGGLADTLWSIEDIVRITDELKRLRNHTETLPAHLAK